jgi:hypothetical protein
MPNQSEKNRIELEVASIKGIIAPIMGNWPELFARANWREVIGERTVFIDVTHEAQANKEDSERFEEIKQTLVDAAQRILNKLSELGYSVTNGRDLCGYISGNQASLQIRCSLTAIHQKQEEIITSTEAQPEPHIMGTKILDPQ